MNFISTGVHLVMWLKQVHNYTLVHMLAQSQCTILYNMKFLWELNLKFASTPT